MSTTVATQGVQAPSKPDFGKGKYSMLMETVWEDTQVLFHISSKAAELLAKSIATELGLLLSNARAEIKVGRTIKEGRVTLSEAAKLKGVPMTNNIAILRTLQYINESGMYHIVWAKTEWKLVSSLVEYLDTFEERAEELAEEQKKAQEQKA